MPVTPCRVANSQQLPSIPDVIGSMNGGQWVRRWNDVRACLMNVSMGSFSGSKFTHTTDLTGSSVYAKEGKGEQETRYDIVNAWQVNYVRGICSSDGSLQSVSLECYNDELFFGDFHSAWPGTTVLDIGCNTGKNMTRAKKYSGTGTIAYGIDYSQDSVNIAREIHGPEFVFQGDASANFVDEHGWQDKFSIVQCTAVFQHMTPEQVKSALGNISRCLMPGGRLLLTFKDSPTMEQMTRWGMGHWAKEVFTADLVSPGDYLCNGFQRAVMWDDDYYPGVTSGSPPKDRDITKAGLHFREFMFYSLDWMKKVASQCGLIPERVEVQLDSKIPYSALHWMVVFWLPAN